MRPIWQGVAIHHAAARDLEGVDLEVYRQWHVKGRGWSDVGYHAVVERISNDYQVLLGRPLYRVGAHAKGANRTHIGVCFAGDFSSDPPSHTQLLAGAHFIAGLCSICWIPVEKIQPHRELVRHTTSCPGEAFPMDKLREMVAELVPDIDSPTGVAL